MALAATVNGDVGLLAGTTAADDTVAYQTVTISYKHAGGTKSAVVGIDQ